MAAEVLIVRTGTANLASVLAGLRRAGAVARVTDNRGEIAAAERLVLPGVGAFRAVVEGLVANDLVDVLRDRICEGRPTLAVCLGLQVLCEGSEESPGITGLGVLPVRARQIPDRVHVPQLGWNRLEVDCGCRFLEPGYAYFANSYCLIDRPDAWNCAFVEHGVRFVAALERGAVLACQFHPELSGPWGHALLKRWLACTNGDSATC